MSLTRRESLRLFGGLTAAALLPRPRLLAYAASRGVEFKVGVTDWNLRQETRWATEGGFAANGGAGGPR